MADSPRYDPRAPEPEPQAAARRYAITYHRETGKTIRVIVDHAREITVIEEGYVHWLEERLARYEAP